MAIQIDKTDHTSASPQNSDHSDKLQDMENRFYVFLEHLDKPYGQFNSSDAFDELLRYLDDYERVLYSTISTSIYAHFDRGDTADPAGTIQSNLENLLNYSNDKEEIEKKKSKLIENERSESDIKGLIEKTQKTILKIWDHVTLASQQYIILKQSDAEYDEKFKKRIASYKEEMSKEMNAQMITMVGIFTALAFLVFGSITSLDGIFENIDFPLFKVMSIGLIWGLCVSNMIFVFLYCIGKMTKLNFKANQSTKANIFQRYPIVWWTNILLVSLLLLSTWLWFMQCTGIGEAVLDLAESCPLIPFILGFMGTVFIICLIVGGIIMLSKKTHFSEDNE